MLIGVDLQPEGCERSFLPKTVFFHFVAPTSESDAEHELSLPAGLKCQEMKCNDAIHKMHLGYHFFFFFEKHCLQVSC